MTRIIVAALCACLIVAASAGAGPNLVVGAAENAVLSADPANATAQLRLATRVGLTAVRVSTTWSPGQTAPDPSLLSAYTTTTQQAALLGVRVYLEVYPDPPAVPADAAGRNQFRQYLQALVTALPQVHDFVIGTQANNPAYWPQNARGVAAYLALLADSYDALKSIDPSIQVIGASLDAQHTPGTWILSLGQAYRKSGRTTPIMDALAIQPQNDTAAQPPAFVHPKGPIGIGDYPRLIANLKRAFSTTPQPGATLPIIYDGYGVQTTIPPQKASLYTGTETDATTEQTQATDYADALHLAACQPNVIALLYQHTIDDRDLAALQTGLYYPDLTPKSSTDTIRTAIAATAAEPSTSCGQPTPAQPQKPQAPSQANLQLTLNGPTATLSCDRACYYVAVLENSHNIPLQARQGSLDTAATAHITLADAKLPPGRYHLAVNAIPRINPSQGITQTGEPFQLP